MANLLSGRLPPPEGMTYEQFLEHSMYIALREFIRVYNGPAEARNFDKAYEEGRRINQETVGGHPLGKMIADLGAAMHGGGVMFGWNNSNGTMNWNDFARTMRWYAQLPARAKSTALRRIREGSETPWQAPPQEQRPVQRGTTGQPNPQDDQQQDKASTDLVLRSGYQNQQEEKPAESTGMSTLSWLLIAAIVVGAGFLIYRSINKSSDAASANPSPGTKPEVKQLPEQATTPEGEVPAEEKEER
jgi:hypothetical protein